MGTLNLSGKEEHDDCPVHQRESSGAHRRVHPGRQGHGATGLVIQRDRRGREREESTLVLLPGTRARANQRPAPRCPSPSLADTFTCALGVTSD